MYKNKVFFNLNKGKGDKMAITSESQMIDIGAINSGCAIIEEAAADYTTCSKLVSDSAEICTGEALSVEDKTMQPSLEELATAIGGIEANIGAFTAQIRSIASQIYTNQLAELQAYQAEQAKKNNES